MNALSSLKARLPLGAARKFARRFTHKARLARALSPYLPEATCIDVGASYYPHTRWHLFLESPAATWIAVEPNEANIGYVDSWPWRSRVLSCTTGLSKGGGAQTLYITNVDSGSSLLEPQIPASMSRRVRNLDYFFPLRTQKIETLTLAQVIEGQKTDGSVFVKLDTQGTELSILSGAEDLIRDRRIIGIELEATLLAQPVMRGGGKFWQACQYLEDLGLELLLIHPIYGPSRFGLRRPRGLTFLNECDAVFAVRQDIAAGLPTEYRVGLLAFYLCNRLFEEALVLLAEDATVNSFLAARGCPVETLSSAIRVMA
jgi:FkbM family methyltransferase